MRLPTPKPWHTSAQMDQLVDALSALSGEWRPSISEVAQAEAAGE